MQIHGHIKGLAVAASLVKQNHGVESSQTFQHAVSVLAHDAQQIIDGSQWIFTGSRARDKKLGAWILGPLAARLDKLFVFVTSMREIQRFCKRETCVDRARHFGK